MKPETKQGMKLRVLTVPLDAQTELFDDSRLEAELRGKKVLEYTHYLMERTAVPKVVFVIGYEDAPEPGSEREPAPIDDERDAAADNPPSGSRRPRGAGAWQARLAERDQPLFATLRSWRNTTAAAREEPGYRVVTNGVLAAVAALRPRTPEELLLVPGVGPRTIARYAEELIAVVAAEPDAGAAGGRLPEPVEPAA